MRGNRQHRLMIAMAVEQPIDQVQIARTTTARADGELTGSGGVRTGSERGDFFVPRMHPAD